MNSSKMMKELRHGLQRAHRERGAVSSIAGRAGIHPSTVFKVMSGSTTKIGVPNFELLWRELAEEGHVKRTFEFPVDTTMACNGHRKTA